MGLQVRDNSRKRMHTNIRCFSLIAGLVHL